MTILVTGAAGFIGSNVSRRMIESNENVVGIDNFDDYYDRSIKETNLQNLKNLAGFKFYFADIRDYGKIKEIFMENKIDKVIHLAARPGVRASIGNSQIYNEINVSGTINLLDISCEEGVRNFIFASSSSVYGDCKKTPFREEYNCAKPMSPYALTKRTCEMLGYSYYHLHGLNFTALRFFSVYGPCGRPDMMPYRIFDSISTGKEINVYNKGQLKRDWTYIDDIVDGIILSSNRLLGYRIINLGKGEPIKLDKFINLTKNLIGKNPNIKYIDAPKSEMEITFADISRAKNLLGYKPKTSLEEGLNLMWEWFQSR